MPDTTERTLLFGGLTWVHHECLGAALQSLGYRARALPVPDDRDLAVGRQHGNRGWCNPMYYTLGNLLRFLQEARAAGDEGIAKRHTFLTAASCGPCRFGMYASTYARALADNGFGELLLVPVSLDGGLRQDTEVSSFRLDARFFCRALRALMVGDLLNALSARIRPYEITAGDTDRALDAAVGIVATGLRQGRTVGPLLTAARRCFESVRVDYFRVKPVVKVVGEFWAAITEGDGNYRVHRWLEEEGAEVHPDPVSGFVDYLLWGRLQRLAVQARVPPRRGGPRRLRVLRTFLGVGLGQMVFRFTYERYRRLLGGSTEPLPRQSLIARYAAPYFSPDIRGGEGHLEVGKHVDAVRHHRAHLVLSVKPFGCLPSTMSDGVQYLVLEHFPGSLFLAVETTGDAEVIARGRIQMTLFEAKAQARLEFERAVATAGQTPREAHDRAIVKGLLRPIVRLPHRHVGTAANLIAAVGRRNGPRQPRLA